MSTDQRNLFDRSPPPWEQDDAAEQLVATVVFPTGPQQTFDYAVPERLRGHIESGRRVRAPLGRGDRLVVGYCVDVATRTIAHRKLKEVADVVDQQRLLSPAMLRMTQWLAEEYLCSWGQALDAVLPAGVRAQAGTRRATFLHVPTAVAARLSVLELPKKQAQILQFLVTSPEPITPRQLAIVAKCTMGPINALRRKNLIRSETRVIQSGDHEEVAVAREQHLVMNADQQQALDAVLGPMNEGRHETILIHGITGSGKTEVYIQAIDEVLRFGRQAIVLVPEISLTPQTRQRFRSRFDRVAVLHSHLRDAERHWHWERIARGEIQVVVGARSAIFAPAPHLGLIVLDEEHESSFKQDSAPRYNARDVALYRAKAEGVPLILGSATPSLESWHKALTGEFRLVEMPRRILQRPMPAVGTIDLRGEFQSRRTRGAISRQLHQAMDEALKSGGQIILLLNRRGFSTHIQCPACGKVVRCPNCDLALTHHRHEELALCHYCDFQQPPPAACPECRFEGIRYGGVGTQKLEAEVRARFPDVTCLRMDTDTMQGPGSHERALAKFRSGEVKILLGTQMIAKGLDFPSVTLVGVINADTALHFPDFRSAERTFQLVTQVAGRTGRGERGGRVLVQTFSPEHPSIQAAARHDFERFAAQELPIREALKYPPYTSMIRIVVRGPAADVAAELAQTIRGRLTLALKGISAEVRILGPAPAPLAKLRGYYRFHLQLHGVDRTMLREAVKSATTDLKLPEEVFWMADVDPLDML